MSMDLQQTRDVFKNYTVMYECDSNLNNVINIVNADGS